MNKKELINAAQKELEIQKYTHEQLADIIANGVFWGIVNVWIWSFIWIAGACVVIGIISALVSAL